MAPVEVSRTLVKSPPELWAELNGGRLSEAVGPGSVRPTEDERSLLWEAGGASGSATLEPSGWGTRVTLRADLAALEVAPERAGLWARLRGRRTAPPPSRPDPEQLEQRLERLLDDLGSAHRKPFRPG